MYPEPKARRLMLRSNDVATGLTHLQSWDNKNTSIRQSTTLKGRKLTSNQNPLYETLARPTETTPYSQARPLNYGYNEFATGDVSHRARTIPSAIQMASTRHISRFQGSACQELMDERLIPIHVLTQFFQGSASGSEVRWNWDVLESGLDVGPYEGLGSRLGGRDWLREFRGPKLARTRGSDRCHMSTPHAARHQ